MSAFIVELPNSPGSLAMLSEAVAERGINITGAAGATAGQVGSMAFTTDDDAATRTVLGERGWVYREVAVVTARVEDRLGIKVEPVDAPLTAIKGSDIVGLATSNMGLTPIVSGDWFEPGMHINAIGAVGMGRVEIDNRTFERSSLVVVDALEDCIAGAQELIDALAAGAVRREQLVELSQIVSGKKPCWQAPRSFCWTTSRSIVWRWLSPRPLVGRDLKPAAASPSTTWPTSRAPASTSSL